jgi:predicted nucleotidyltransferase component of viral defense system
MEHRGTNLDIETWVEQSFVGQREFRQAVHVILCAIAHTAELRERMIMKGGILLGLRYQSSRFTKDIDFSTSLKLSDLPPNEIREQFDQALPLAVERLDYGLDCRVQRFEVRPPNEDATFPSLRLSIGYAYQGTPKHKRLMALSCPDKVSVDFSLNEPILDVEALSLGASNDGSILTYAFSDLVAEKIRSLLQQEIRNRYRRQDAFDLHYLLNLHSPDQTTRKAILESLLKKARSRNIDVQPDSLANREIRRRAQRDYNTLSDEITEPLPPFDIVYSTVEAFYQQLPWDILPTL